MVQLGVGALQPRMSDDSIPSAVQNVLNYLRGQPQVKRVQTIYFCGGSVIFKKVVLSSIYLSVLHFKSKLFVRFCGSIKGAEIEEQGILLMGKVVKPDKAKLSSTQIKL